jgi:hypothetical protein
MGRDEDRTGEKGGQSSIQEQEKEGAASQIKSVHPSIPIHSSIDAYYCTRRKRQQDK